MTQAEKLALAETFRDTVASINAMSTTMAANDIKCITTITGEGSLYTLEWGATEWPSTMNVTEIVGCEQF